MRNEALQSWIQLVAAHASPARIHWCDGSERELEMLRQLLLADGKLLRVTDPAYPGCFLHRSDPTDAVRSERYRFVCTPHAEDAGPTNRWMSEEDAYASVWPLFARAMAGRTLFVVPYLLGAPRSKYAQVGVQLTDSPWVALLMGTLTRMGNVALQHLGSSGDFVRGLHSSLDRQPERRFLVHFPLTQTCWSTATDYPESAALFKSHVLSLASAQAPEEGFLAEHMAVIRVIDPRGASHYLAAAFPSGCGKTRLATLTPALPEWKVEMVADGACLLRVGDDGRLWALNPAWGVDVAIGNANRRTDRGALALFARDALFTNLALRRNGSPWWEGSGEPPGDGVLDWQGREWPHHRGAPAAHPNARSITTPHHYSLVSSRFYDPDGVPLSAILFGGRRPTLAPLIYEATSWAHGVYVAATSRSEAGPGSVAGVGVLRNDPMAMLPFCSYNMADYFGHWLSLGRELQRPPRIFHVNWFRRGEHGQLLWPGFGENIRVIAWILERLQHSAHARLTPIGLLPEAFDTRGLQLEPNALEQLLQVDTYQWLQESKVSEEFLGCFGSRLPHALRREQEAFAQRLRVALN